MTNKVIGYVLIGLGVLIIAFAAFSVLNVFIFHLLLAGFVVKVGFRFASLGTMLVRPIVVDLKTKGKS